jgi:hypothetical protein
MSGELVRRSLQIRMAGDSKSLASTSSATSACLIFAAGAQMSSRSSLLFSEGTFCSRPVRQPSEGHVTKAMSRRSCHEGHVK